MTDIKSTIIISSPPFGSVAGKEGVDLALVCAAFDHQVNLVFVADGVLHLKNNQDEAYFDDKFHDLQLKALEFYDVEQVHVEQESMQVFNFTAADLIENVTIDSREKIKELVQQSSHTVTF